MASNKYLCCHLRSQEPHLPPGFRFHPTDEELITYYLLKKVLDCNFTCRAIAEADLNKCEPWQLPGKAKMGEKEWYFFSLRDRKYPTGLRTNRATEAGYWKATGKDREIHSPKTCLLVGMKKTLVFYSGRAPKGEKSNWVIHEYRLEGKLAYHYLSRNSEDEWVISRVFQKPGPGSSPTSACSGSDIKKRPYAARINIGPQVKSRSLPPLLEPTAATTDDLDGRISAATNTKQQHVPCFSISSPPNFSHNSLFALLPPPSDPSAAIYDQSLQENIQQPLFFSTEAVPPMHGGGTEGMFGYNSYASQWPDLENYQKIMCPADQPIDCMWSC
ncbi:hypothetical protein OROMI_017401 [Orobanche minor]